MMKRREFIKKTGFAILAQAAASSLPMMYARTAHAASGKNVIKIFLRGGFDGLSFLVPRSAGQHATYLSGRPTQGLAISQLTSLSGNGAFGLHPSAAGIAQLYAGGESILFHGAGSLAETRSHFTQMAHIECGDMNSLREDGYFYRALGSSAKALEMVSVGTELAQSMKGNRTRAGSMNLTADFADLKWHQDFRSRTEKADRIWGMARGKFNDCSGLDGRRVLLCQTAADAVTSMDHMDQALSQMQNVSELDQYGTNATGSKIREAVKLVTNPSLNSRIINVDINGWDHHKNQGVVGGVFDQAVARLDQAIHQASADLKQLGRWNDTVIMVMSEFGRSIAENGAQGSDHGRGGVIMLFGGQLRNGRRVIAPDFDLLRPDLRDVRVTVDYRSIMAEVMQKHLNLSAAQISQAFPGFSGGAVYGIL